MTAPLTPLTDEQFDSYAEIVQANTWKESKARIVIADARLHRAALAEARAEVERLKDQADAIIAYCDIERAHLGAIDGYDYKSGQEFGLRQAVIELERRFPRRAALAPEGKEGG